MKYTHTHTHTQVKGGDKRKTLCETEDEVHIILERARTASYQPRITTKKWNTKICREQRRRIRKKGYTKEKAV